ncbi:MAG TPA: saccharopine dehydrogenase NADP-binding domain-containing protein [Pyrinomonadaceae bacterium]|nr:saccharopine dehydrogenase NADP-binding domain-containing protein [Pyrinomonadaceae bacterium]
MRKVTVYGAYGHTGRFIVAELVRRGIKPILSGRHAAKLRRLGDAFPGSEIRGASIDDALSLDRAIDGAAAIINCAGPFLDTAPNLIEAALRSGVHYLDVTAEQKVVLDAFEKYAKAAQDAKIVIAPAIAFYGGLADLLATAAMRDWAEADEISIAVALDNWWPTSGTRLTGKRNTFRRFTLSNGRLEFLADPPPTRMWSFPESFGIQEVVALPFSEIITISRHLPATEIHSYINLAPLNNLRDPDTPEPVAADETGLSAQRFVMEVIVRKDGGERRARATGRDIYAITAPIIVEATQRIIDDHITRVGVATAGELFDAERFLQALSGSYPFLEIQVERSETKIGVSGNK